MPWMTCSLTPRCTNAWPSVSLRNGLHASARPLSSRKPLRSCNLAESEAASYRSDSAMASNYQQSVTQTRRILARVQAQVQGARVDLPMGLSGRSGRATMGPPSHSGLDHGHPDSGYPMLSDFGPPRPLDPRPAWSSDFCSARKPDFSPAHRRSLPEFDESQWAV
jgi:hypothetical protein